MMSSMFNYELGVMVILLNKRKDIEKIKQEKKKLIFALCGEPIYHLQELLKMTN